MTSTAMQPVGTRPQSLTEIAFDRIRDAITGHTLAPGTRVSESMLSEMLNVSKTPVREALLRLCHIGLVEPTSRGLRVLMPTRRVVRDAFELRGNLEAGAARTAAGRADAAGRGSIARAAGLSLENAQAHGAGGFREWEGGFHMAVAEATGNTLLANAVRDSLLLSCTLCSPGVPTPEDSVHCGRRHVEVAEAIEAGQGELAAQLMYGHITEVMSLVLASVRD